MSLEVGRRGFVGSIAAGLPLLAGGAGPTWAQSAVSGLAGDPVALELVGDMKRAVRTLSREGSAEAARRLAFALRLLTVWGASHEFDARVEQTLRGVIAREGKDALVRREADRDRFRAEARALGFDDSSRVPLPTLPAAGYATRVRVIDEIVATGVTRRWAEVARTLEESAVSLERLAATRRGRVQLAQFDQSYCSTIAKELDYLTVEMVFWCAPWFYWVPEPCGMVSSAYLGVWAVQWWLSCP